MSIAFLGPSHPWRGGIAQFAQNMAEILLQKGHDVMMFTYIHQYPELLFPGTDQLDNSKISPKLPTHKILTPYNPLTWFSAANDIRGWKPDILITQYWLPFMAPAQWFIYSHLKKILKVNVIHNAEAHEKWFLAPQLTRLALSKADLHITLSDTTTGALRQILPGLMEKDILQLFHPVYKVPETSEVMTRGGLKNKLLFFGFIKHYKGLDVLLNAMPIVLKTLPEVKLVIAGDVYGDKQVYSELIKRLNLENSVETHFRYIPEEEIGEFFSECDVSVIPYRSATQSGVAQLSFAHEVPVIATKVGGISEVVSDNVTGLLAEAENPIDLAEKIILFYKDNRFEEFKTNIREQNRKFSWESFTAQMLEKLT
jgi:D-inositol-3-phosphate glycosyltransferase